MPTKYARIDDLAVHYAHGGGTTLPDQPPPLGKGAALLLVHGEGGSGALWARQLAHFAAEHSPVAVDLPAHGRSSGLDGPASAEDAAALLGRFLEALGAPPAVVVGHGLGGQVALLLALREPARVRAVVTIGTAAKADPHQQTTEKIRLVVKGRLGQQFDTPFFGPSPEMNAMREFWSEMVKTDPKVRLSDLVASSCCDLRGRLADIGRPTLVIQGEADQLCPRAAAEELAKAIPGARLCVVPGAGHVAHLEKPAEVNQAIADFVAGLGTR
jgi:pimeloyl-ACP methyl ester carboxylesterase